MTLNFAAEQNRKDAFKATFGLDATVEIWALPASAPGFLLLSFKSFRKYLVNLPVVLVRGPQESLTAWAGEASTG